MNMLDWNNSLQECVSYLEASLKNSRPGFRYNATENQYGTNFDVEKLDASPDEAQL